MIAGAILSPPDDSDRIYEHVAAAPAGCYNAPLPPKYMLPVSITPRDQGQRPTCVAQAAAVMAQINKNTEPLSPEFVYSLRTTIRRAGMYCRDAMRILQTIGTVSESKFPYQPRDDMAPEPGEALRELAAANKIDNYSRVNTVDGVKQCLLELKVPLIATVSHYSSERQFWKAGGGPKAYHAVLIVGYNAEGLVLLNSWGADWGDGGTCLMPYADWPEVHEVWALS